MYTFYQSDLITALLAHSAIADKKDSEKLLTDNDEYALTLIMRTAVPMALNMANITFRATDAGWEADIGDECAGAVADYLISAVQRRVAGLPPETVPVPRLGDDEVPMLTGYC